MKCDSSSSENNAMNIQGCSIKLRTFILVINTADLINELATPSLGMSHALTAPTTLFTTYIFIGIFVICAIYKHYASWFLQLYALVACCFVQISLSLVVFKGLKTNEKSKYHAAFVLDGILPMINGLLLVVDLIGLIFSNREDISTPSISTTSPTDLR